MITPKVVAFDFDGVIHYYDGWKGKETINSPIDLDNMRRELKKLCDNNWRIAIWTCRANTDIVRIFMEDNDLPYDYVNENPWAPDNVKDCRKIVADVYIDDRSVDFSGSWEGMADKIMNFKPWWKRKVKRKEVKMKERPQLPLNLFGMHADQISIFTIDAEKTVNEYKKIGYDKWVIDNVLALSWIPHHYPDGTFPSLEEIKNNPRQVDTFEVKLCFNYDIMPVEFELISVERGSTIQISEEEECGLSHIGFHVDDLQVAVENFANHKFGVMAYIETHEHSSCPHFYNYVFIDTRKFGFITKLIKRREVK